jgi:FkbM family methyltransferase
LGSWPSVYPAFAVFDPAGFFMNHAHNDFAELAADGGLPLFATVLATFAASLGMIRRAWWVAGVPAAMLNACLDFPLHKSSLGGMMFFLLGALSAQKPTTAGWALPILSGPLRGVRWITRSSVLSCWFGWYEKDWMRQLGEVMRPGSAVFDIGAQAGYHTLHASRLVGAAGHVYAFEPVPRNIGYLRCHLSINQIGNVQLLEAAVGDHDGSAHFTEGAGFMAGHLTPSGELSVPLLSLDRCLEQGRLPAPDVLKIDVEGSELEVLLGASRLLAKHGPAVLIDTHDFLGGDCVGTGTPSRRQAPSNARR